MYPIGRDGGGKHKGLDHRNLGHRGVENVYAAYQIVVVVEPADKMREPLGCIGRQVVHVVKRPVARLGRRYRVRGEAEVGVFPSRRDSKSEGFQVGGDGAFSY